MSGITVDVRNGDLEKALQVFKSKVRDANVIRDVVERSHFIPNTEKRRRKDYEQMMRHKE